AERRADLLAAVRPGPEREREAAGDARERVALNPLREPVAPGRALRKPLLPRRVGRRHDPELARAARRAVEVLEGDEARRADQVAAVAERDLGEMALAVVHVELREPGVVRDHEVDVAVGVDVEEAGVARESRRARREPRGLE